MILTVAFRFFRNVPHRVPQSIKERDVEKEMCQDIVSHPPLAPETIAVGFFSITIYIGPAKDSSHAECQHTLLPGFDIIKASSVL